MKCPNCQTDILADDVNIQADIAKCAACGHVFTASDNVDPPEEEHFNINQPPQGAWYHRDMNGVVVGASMRSPMALFFIPFTLIWSGGSLGGIYGAQLIQQKFDLTTSLFGLPFLIGSIFLWGMTLMSILGKVEIKLNRQGGEVFKGIGFIGRKKTFLWRELSDTNHKTVNETTFSNSAGHRKITRTISRQTSPIRLPMTLSSKRRHFLAQAIKEIQAQYQ